jgi:hypothetical protein
VRAVRSGGSSSGSAVAVGRLVPLLIIKHREAAACRRCSTILPVEAGSG